MLSPTQVHYCPQCGTAMPAEKESPLSCPAADCGFVHYNNPTPIVAAIVEVTGGVVLAHDRRWPPGLFGLVTGFIEAGESPHEAVQREAREELGLSVALGQLIGAYGFAYMNQVIVAYHLNGAGAITLSDELDDYRVIPVEQLRPWSFGTGPAVRDWLDQRGQGKSGDAVAR